MNVAVREAEAGAAGSPSSGLHPLTGEPPDSLFALFDEVFGPGSGQAHRLRFDWEYRQGGLGPDAQLWLFWHQGRPIGSLGLLPATLFVDGQPVPAKFTADLTSSPSYRNRGIGARLMQAFLKADGLSLAYAVSHDARALLTRMGFREVPGLVPMFRVLSLQALARRRYPAPMTAAWTGRQLEKLLGLLDDHPAAWSPLAGRLAGLPLPLRHSRLAPPEPPIISWPGLFPPELDAFADRLARGSSITFAPDAAALERRYLRHPFHHHLIEIAWRGQGQGREVAGYAVWRLFREPDGLTMAILSTLQTLPGDRIALDALLEAGLERIQRTGAFAVKTLASTPFLQTALRRHLFFPHGDTPGLLFHTEDGELSRRLERPWNIDLGTSDIDVG